MYFENPAVITNILHDDCVLWRKVTNSKTTKLRLWVKWLTSSTKWMKLINLPIALAHFKQQNLLHSKLPLSYVCKLDRC